MDSASEGRPSVWRSYLRIANVLRSRIRPGTYPAGTMLPAETALSDEFGVVRNTLQYKRLYDENGNFRPEVGARAVYPSPTAAPSPADTIKIRRVIGEEEE